jgi:hypothetical protein
MLVVQERHRDRRDAGEAGREQPQVGQRHLTPERPQAGVEVGDLGVAEELRDLADQPLRRHPQELVGPLLRRPGAHDLVDRRVLLEDAYEVGDPLVGVAHVGVGPDDDLAARLLGADPPRRARAAVTVERQQPHPRIVGLGRAQHLERVVGGRVVDDEQLVAVVAGVHCRRDPLDLGEDVLLLVVAGQDDCHLHAALVVWWDDLWLAGGFGGVEMHERRRHDRKRSCRRPGGDKYWAKTILPVRGLVADTGLTCRKQLANDA